MSFETLNVRRSGRVMRLGISRPERGNSINAALIRDLGSALDQAEADPECRTVVLEGAPGVFCTGMDFQEAASRDESAAETTGIGDYMRLLRRFTQSRRVVVSLVDGKVIAGGVGLVAASDFVIGSARSEFSLSEALWGLLPCCVLPYLIRRVGFQRAYSMTLTTRTLSAQAAAEIHLLDELADDPEGALRRLSLRLNLLHDETILDLKAYFGRLAAVSPETEEMAVREITRLSELPRVRENIANYVQHGRFPWEPKEPAAPES